jgi:hypothetical protein
MCHLCDEIQRKIDQHRRALREALDTLTEQRIRNGINAYLAEKKALHA